MSKQEKTSHNLTEQEKTNASAIMLCIEIKSSFELYSFRIISPEQFTSRVNELIANYQTNVE